MPSTPSTPPSLISSDLLWFKKDGEIVAKPLFVTPVVSFYVRYSWFQRTRSPCRTAGRAVLAPLTELVVSAIRSRSLSQKSPAAARPRRNRAPTCARARGTTARLGSRLRLQPAPRTRFWVSPRCRAGPIARRLPGLSPSFCSHSLNLIHPLFLAAPTFRWVELAGCGNGLLSCFLSGPGRIPHGLSAS